MNDVQGVWGEKGRNGKHKMCAITGLESKGMSQMEKEETEGRKRRLHAFRGKTVLTNDQARGSGHGNKQQKCSRGPSLMIQ